MPWFCGRRCRPRRACSRRPWPGIDYWGKSAIRRYLADNVFQALLINRQPKGAERSLAAAEAVMAELVAAIDRGRSLIVFPEGTRGLGDEVAPFKSGIYHLAGSARMSSSFRRISRT